jgi:hypothetical protein
MRRRRREFWRKKVLREGHSLRRNRPGEFVEIEWSGKGGKEGRMYRRREGMSRKERG